MDQASTVKKIHSLTRDKYRDGRINEDTFITVTSDLAVRTVNRCRTGATAARREWHGTVKVSS